jgi:hypothetical protein
MHEDRLSETRVWSPRFSRRDAARALAKGLRRGHCAAVVRALLPIDAIVWNERAAVNGRHAIPADSLPITELPNQFDADAASIYWTSYNTPHLWSCGTVRDGSR